MTPDRNLAALMKRYRDGERDADFLKQYLPVLSAAYMQEEVKQVAGAYLDVLPVDEMATEENWALIKSYVRDPLAVPLKTVMAHRGKFYALAGQEAVDAKLTKSIVDAVDELMSWRQARRSPSTKHAMPPWRTTCKASTSPLPPPPLPACSRQPAPTPATTAACSTT